MNTRTGPGLEAVEIKKTEMRKLLEELERGPVYAGVYSKDRSVAATALGWPPGSYTPGNDGFSHAITVVGNNTKSRDLLYVDNDKSMKSMSREAFRRIYNGGIAIRPRGK